MFYVDISRQFSRLHMTKKLKLLKMYLYKHSESKATRRHRKIKRWEVYTLPWPSPLFGSHQKFYVLPQLKQPGTSLW